MSARILFSLILLLAACAPRGDITIAPEAAGVGHVERIYIATNRTPDGRGQEQVSFGRVDVSVPPERQPGSITYPRRGARPDPRRDFLVSEFVRYPRPRDFRADLRHAIAARPAGDRDVVLFVHGYNNTFAEGLYRFAQLEHDLSLPGVPLHFSWPSRGQPLAYAADRETILYSRDALESSIDIATDAGAGKVILVAHSMGAALLMESLRQMAIGGKRQTLDRIGGVVLLSPDINVDLFRMQAKAIGRLPQPFVIFTSGRDRALSLSALISAEEVRLGSLTDAAPVADLPVTLVDVGAFSTGDGHFNVATSPALLQILSQAQELNQKFSLDASGGLGPLTRATLHAERAAQIVISPAF
ncbi:alpha/beta fold hydrolase [Paracoccus kondratievae]|uniref:alpha/beta hydrolase n=1 Tax=Paracoccus TaxID=265 RepID=UPI000225F45A|nr:MULTISPECIES: alpha/beta fold hydrolase [Paracoccus]QFQ87949.1 alpha/beta fold hydrolase [Paracoccus kondratievae]SMG43106.1 Esterase/lipase superfamily enzyme [Paracoccus sp. J56]